MYEEFKQYSLEDAKENNRCVFVCLCVSLLYLALYPSSPVVRWAHSDVVNTLPESFKVAEVLLFFTRVCEEAQFASALAMAGGHHLFFCVAGTDWNASSDITATVWRRDSD